MDIALRGLHVGFGELTLLSIIAAIFFLMWGSSKHKLLIAKTASLVGVISAFISWLVSGLYYVIFYGSQVKPTIKGGPWPWAHSIFMEAKEHIFLFLPFFAILFMFLIWKYGDEWDDDSAIRSSGLAIGIITVLIPVLMMVSGYLVSSGYRIATLD